MSRWLPVLVLALSGCPGDLIPIDSDNDTDQDQILIGILLTPELVTVPLGDEVQLTATGLYEDRSTTDLTAVVDWRTSSAAVAQVSSGLDNEGVVRGMGVGSAVVTASFDAITSPDAKVTVSDASLLGVTVEPKNVTVEQGATVQLRAQAAFSDGTRSDATSQVRWITSNGRVATMAADGTLTGENVGDATITADWDGNQSAPVEVEVVQGGQADLRIDAVEFESGDGEVTITLRIENAGNVGASDYWVDVFIDPDTEPAVGVLSDTYFPMFYTEAAETSEAVFTMDAAEGSHTFWAVIDSSEAVDEASESNNVSSHSFTVEADEAGTNLVLTSFDFVADSESIYYFIDVTNQGSEPVGAFYVDLWIDEISDPTASGLGDHYVRIDGLDGGESDFADFFLEDTFCEYCWSWAMVDTNLEVEETNEEDNIVGPITVEAEP